jgi:hypothetical protein
MMPSPMVQELCRTFLHIIQVLSLMLPIPSEAAALNA